MEQAIEAIIASFSPEIVGVNEAPMRVQFTPEIILCPGSVLLTLKNRISCLRIQARAPRSLKLPRSKPAMWDYLGCGANGHKLFLPRVITVNEPLLVMCYKTTVAHQWTYGIIPSFSKLASVVVLYFSNICLSLYINLWVLIVFSFLFVLASDI